MEIALLWPRTGSRGKTSREDADPEAQLIERLLRRDEHAFMDLYDRHRRSVYRFLLHMTGSTSTAEDLTQGVFVAMLDAISSSATGQFDPRKGTLEGYLLGIARNLARRERRKAQRLVPLETMIENAEWTRVLPQTFPDGPYDTESLLTLQADLKLLYRAILGLPHPYRETIALCALQEKSYQQAALILECSEGTIASRMNRARALLAAKIRRTKPAEVNASAS